MTIQELFECMNRIAPFSLAESWDNSGFLVGDPKAKVTAALVCLDITDETISEALDLGANVLISHHPVIFHPLRRLTVNNPVYRLAHENLGAICAHTNLDIADGGVNDALADTLGLCSLEPLEPCAADPGQSLGRVGTLREAMSPEEFASYAARMLSPAGGVRFVAGNRPVRRVAVCGGAGGSLLQSVLSCGADAFVTGELKHDVLLSCAAEGLTALDAGHFDTERVVLAPLAARLTQLCADIPFVVSRQQSPVQLIHA